MANKHLKEVARLQKQINDIEEDLETIGKKEDYRNPANYELKRNKLREKYDVEGRFDSLDKLLTRLNTDMDKNKKVMSMKYVADPRHFFLSEKLPEPSNTKHTGYIFNPNYIDKFDPTSEWSLEQKEKIDNNPKNGDKTKLQIDNRGKPSSLVIDKNNDKKPNPVVTDLQKDLEKPTDGVLATKVGNVWIKIGDQGNLLNNKSDESVVTPKPREVAPVTFIEEMGYNKQQKERFSILRDAVNSAQYSRMKDLHGERKANEYIDSLVNRAPSQLEVEY